MSCYSAKARNPEHPLVQPEDVRFTPQRWQKQTRVEMPTALESFEEFLPAEPLSAFVPPRRVVNSRLISMTSADRKLVTLIPGDGIGPEVTGAPRRLRQSREINRLSETRLDACDACHSFNMKR